MTMEISLLSWDQFFLSICYVCAKRSKDPHTQVGSCIVNWKKEIVATGYNGLPRGLVDDPVIWKTRVGSLIDQKYTYVVHAEMNAIMSANCRLDGCVLYTTLLPCYVCAKLIVQAGIKTVYYAQNKYPDSEDVTAACAILQQAQVSLVKMSELQITVKNA